MNGKNLKSDKENFPEKQLLIDINNLFMFYLLYGMVLITCKGFLNRKLNQSLQFQLKGWLCNIFHINRPVGILQICFV